MDILSRYQDFLRIPSVSTILSTKRICSAPVIFWWANYKNLGTDHVEVFPTPMHPIFVRGKTLFEAQCAYFADLWAL
jgi:hypothetical protein